MEKNLRNTPLVAVLGAAAVDMIIQVKEFPSPDGIVMADTHQSVPGGTGGNVAEGIARLGYPVRFLGVVGDDDNGRLLLQSFKNAGVQTDYIMVDPKGSTASCFIAVNNQGERMIFSLGGSAIYVEPGDLDPTALENVDVLYIADAFPGVALAAIKKLKSDALVVYCPGGLMLSLGEEYYMPVLEAADVVIFNRVEASDITGRSDPEEALNALAGMGVPTPVITLGKKGVVFFADGKSTLVPSETVKNVVDTTGAGDAFSVGLVAGILEKISWKEAVQLGCQVAAYKIQHRGAREGLPYRDQIAALNTREDK